MKFVLLIVFAVFAADGADDGDIMCDLYGETGICKFLKKCPTALLDLKRRKSPPPPVCGMKGSETIVCCKIERENVLTTTERYTGPTTTEYIPTEPVYEDLQNRFKGGDCRPIPPELTTEPTGQKAWDKCLEYQSKYVFPCVKTPSISGMLGRVNLCHHNADELIIDGEDAKLYEFPHMVLLGYQNPANKVIWQCGGTLISERFVLTAAHCTADTSHYNVSHALIGVLRRSEESEKNRYSIRRIFTHEKYHSPDKYNDIALLELDRAVPLDNTTVPACLHTGDPVDDSRASATGWGTTSKTRPNVNPDVLQKVILTKFQTRECAGEYGYSRLMKEGYHEESQICYGDRTKSQDTCQGDSGGPLMVKSKKIGCMYILIGVTSFGQECGWTGVPGIYTRVSNYIPWIESIVWPN